MYFLKSKLVSIGTITLGILLIGGGAFAGSELDSEINSLQVQLQPSHPQPKKVASHKKPVRQAARKAVATRPVRRTTLVASNDNYVPAPPSAPVAPPALPKDNYYKQPAFSNTTTTTTTDQVSEEQASAPSHFHAVDDSDESISRVRVHEVDMDDAANNVLERVSLVPSLSISSFDGAAGSQVIPSGVSNPVNLAPATTLTVDINPLGTDHFVLEGGADFIQTGAQTGFLPSPWMPTNVWNEKVTLSYAGIPIDAKWMARGEHASSFYATLGVNPIFLVGHQYQSYSGYDEEFRFGGYGVMDVLLTGGAGYNFKLSKHYQLDVSLGVYQGTIPVLSTYNVYNVGGTAGIGLAYIL